MLSSLISLLALLPEEIANAATSTGESAAEAAQNGADASQTTGFNWSGIIMIVVLFAVFYFLLIRPQQKKQKEIRKMRESLKVGDQIVTAGGIYGKITDVKDNAFIISIDDSTKIKVDKGSVYASAADVQQSAK